MTVAAVAFIVLALAALALVAGHWAKASSVDLIDGNGTATRISVEIADTPQEQEIGLMNRTSLPEDSGMLFVFGSDQRWTFWMSDTLIPLDMIFIADNLTIVDIRANATPMSTDHIVPSGSCRYVLEVNGGLCEDDGIEVGDHVRLDV